MRYCLGCRHLSADGPLCTSCGRSFGGRLCGHKKQRHLNPPDANVCGQCGNTSLTDAASYLPFRWPGRLLFWAGGGWFALRCGPQVPGWAARQFTRSTGFRSPAVWAMEELGHVLILLFAFYFLSMFMPGEAGKQFRGVLTTIVNQAVRFFFETAQKIILGMLKLLLRLCGLTGNTKEKSGTKQ